MSVIHPDDRRLITAALHRILKGGETNLMVEARHRALDGSWHMLEAMVTNCLDDPAVQGFVVTSRDITERKTMEAALRASEERLRTVLTHAPLVLALLDRDGVYTLSEGKALSKLGLATDSRLGKSIFEIYRDRPDIAEAARCALAGEETTTRLHFGGVPFESRFLPVRNEHGETDGALIVSIDITDREQAEEVLVRQAHYDALTGLPNRRLLYERIEQALAIGLRTKAYPALLFIDLDGFKAVNDTLGHEVGDALLFQVAGRLAASTRESDTVARLGGDEFVVLLPAVTDRSQAAAAAAKLLEEVRRPYRMGRQEVRVGASIGVSYAPDDGDAAESLLARADEAMYGVKHNGKNGYALAGSQEEEQGPTSLEPHDSVIIPLRQRA